jgi:uncharacterized protein (UPF0335 family)
MNGIGHNSSIQEDQLRALVERIENKEAEKKEISSDIRDLYIEAKSKGYDVKALRAAVQRRKQDPGEYEEFSAVVEIYLNAIGLPA